MKRMLRILMWYTFAFCGISCFAQKPELAKSKSYLDYNWNYVANNMPNEWYGTAESKMAADSVLKYQTAIGGWSKNHNYHKGIDQKEWVDMTSSGVGATFDNGATITEIRFLVKMYGNVKDQRYKSAFDKAFNYILIAQYPNGGWPQFFPFRKGKSIAYNSHITYNDNAMVNVLTFLKEAVEGDPFYAPMQISSAMKQKAKIAFDKGIDCILKTQIIIDGKPTVWCAQHDEVTLAPANARAYELASFSGTESANIIYLLMKIKNPSPEIINSIKGGKIWFEQHKIEGVRLEQIINSDGLKDLVVVQDKNAPTLWARFYDLETGLPFFCDRDGIKRKTFAEMGYNRRNGYSWYTNSPEKLIKKYPEWAKNNGVN